MNGPEAGSMFSTSTRWSLLAGVYAFLCSVVLLVVLSPVSDSLVKLLGLPEGYSAVLLAAPVLVVGAVVWWAVVEWREAYTYPLGAVYGLATALATATVWVLVFAAVWGVSLVLAGGILVVFVVAVTVPAGLVVGVPLMAARRLTGGASTGPDGVPR